MSRLTIDLLLSSTDDHHEELVRADQRNCGPRGHLRARQAMAEAVRDVGRDTQAEEPPRSVGTAKDPTAPRSPYLSGRRTVSGIMPLINSAGRA